jgi:HEPN domain-containing protein
MNVDDVVQYWIELAQEDWPVVEHLYASRDYRYALFIGHLYLEKLLKALVVRVLGEHAPRTYNLLLLAERAGLVLSEDRRNALIRITNYSIVNRYPDDPAAIRRRYTQEYTQAEIGVMQDLGRWCLDELERINLNAGGDND